MTPMITNSPKGAPVLRPQKQQSAIDGWFQISKRGSTVSGEVRGGLVNFFTMAYILALNPLIIGTAADRDGNLIWRRQAPPMPLRRWSTRRPSASRSAWWRRSPR